MLKDCYTNEEEEEMVGCWQFYCHGHFYQVGVPHWYSNMFCQCGKVCQFLQMDSTLKRRLRQVSPQMIGKCIESVAWWRNLSAALHMLLHTGEQHKEAIQGRKHRSVKVHITAEWLLQARERGTKSQKGKCKVVTFIWKSLKDFTEISGSLQ